MTMNNTQVPFGMRPPVTKPIPEFLIEVGEAGIRELINKHYDLIKQSSIAHLFPINAEDFEKAKQHSSDFFIQICGGRAYFNENRGAPQMIGRHAPFRIDATAREIWLELYKPLLEELQKEGVTETSLRSFWDYLDIFSLWMINTK
ncbi:MAG: globin [Sulfurimonas sp.]|nr:globin [Sulfurimonas sp.]MDD5203353.1 globin [Sulfurimonas sp.]